MKALLVPPSWRFQVRCEWIAKHRLNEDTASSEDWELIFQFATDGKGLWISFPIWPMMIFQFSAEVQRLSNSNVGSTLLSIKLFWFVFLRLTFYSSKFCTWGGHVFNDIESRDELYSSDPYHWVLNIVGSRWTLASPFSRRGAVLGKAFVALCYAFFRQSTMYQLFCLRRRYHVQILCFDFQCDKFVCFTIAMHRFRFMQCSFDVSFIFNYL
jgi:hypothetical protein